MRLLLILMAHTRFIYHAAPPDHGTSASAMIQPFATGEEKTVQNKLHYSTGPTKQQSLKCPTKGVGGESDSEVQRNGT